MKLLSCDPSLANTGFCIYDTITHNWKTRPLPQLPGKHPRVVTLGRLYSYTKKHLHKLRPDIFVVESYAFAASTRSLTQLAEVGGVVRLAAYQVGLPIIEVTPGEWKKITLGEGKGNLKKDDVRTLACKMVKGLSDLTQDEIDAFLMAKAVDIAIVQHENPSVVELRKRLGEIGKLATIYEVLK
jgi:Holliday junction resolvasome RuvABC endonuclease subunit